MIYPPNGAETRPCPKCGELMRVRDVEYFGLCFSRKEWCCSGLRCDYEEPVIGAAELPIKL